MYETQHVIPDNPATYEDLFNIPEHHIGEIINGRLSVMPTPALPHARTSTVLGGHLAGCFDCNPKGIERWWILDKPELHLTKNNQKDIIVPDLVGWKRNKVKKLPRTANTNIVPDWVCEVLSPSTGKRDRVDKMPIYAKHGVNYLWLIDPILHVLEAYELKNGKWLLLTVIGEDMKASVVPFDAIEFPLEILWL